MRSNFKSEGETYGKDEHIEGVVGIFKGEEALVAYTDCNGLIAYSTFDYIYRIIGSCPVHLHPILIREVNMEEIKLTKKQKQVYDFIKMYMQKNKKSPYIREIQESCGIISYKCAVDKLLALEKKGYIKRTLNKHRSIITN